MVYAIEAHQGVNHLYDGHPYSVHLFLVQEYCNKYVGAFLVDVAECIKDACWLHDVIEDCRKTYNDVKKEFGREVADLVYACTNDKGRTRAERAGQKYYEGIRDTPYAAFVKLCDRLANVRYSKDAKSEMLDKYREENEHFIKSLFPGEIPHPYAEMTVALQILLEA